MHLRTSPCALFVAGLALARPAQAEPGPTPRPEPGASLSPLPAGDDAELQVLQESRIRNRDKKWHVMVEGATDFPVFWGGRAEFEMPGRLRMGGSLGVIPEPYADLAETIVNDLGGFQDPATNQVFNAALENSLVARGFLSWSPFKKRGLYLSAGYSLIQLGGDLESAEVLEQALNYQGEDPISGSVQMSSTMHGIHGELGYRFYAGPVIVRLSAGFTGTVASETRIDVDTENFQEEASALAREGETYVDDILTRYAMVPQLGLGLGYDIGF
ncbi:MAG: hypothetical protein AAGD10_00055 [Myxococcota bacterium]